MVVDVAEQPRRPRTLGENDRLLTKTTSTCIAGTEQNEFRS